MNTRSAKNKTTGLFTVVVTDWNGAEFFRCEFATVEAANEAAATNERRMTVAMQSPSLAPLTAAEILISDDELLAELGA